MWVARVSDNLGKFHEYDLSPYFKDINDCTKYIDEHLSVLRFLLDESFYRVVNHHFEKGKEVRTFSLSLGSLVRPYNVEQKRFATSFDF